MTGMHASEQLEKQLKQLQGRVFRDISSIDVGENFPQRIDTAAHGDYQLRARVTSAILPWP